MKVTWLHPAPHSLLPLSHPARAYTNSEKQPADVRKTMAPYMTDFQREVERAEWLRDSTGER